MQFSQSPSAAPYFPASHQWSELSSLSKVILVLGKARSCRAPDLGCSGAESPGWLEVSPKNSAWNMMHEQVYCCDEAANHQLPIAEAFWIVETVSMEECSSIMQNLIQIHCCTCSVILNVMATRYTCSLHGIYPHNWLVQCSHHCSRMHIPGHSPWLLGYIDVAQTILVILTMVGLFPDRPHIWNLMSLLMEITRKKKDLDKKSG